MLSVLLVEDNERLREAMCLGLEGTGAVRVVGACGTGEEALEAPKGLPLALAFLAFALQERLCGRVDARLGHGDPVQRRVQLAVSGTVEPVALALTGGHLDRR